MKRFRIGLRLLLLLVTLYALLIEWRSVVNSTNALNERNRISENLPAKLVNLHIIRGQVANDVDYPGKHQALVIRSN